MRRREEPPFYVGEVVFWAFIIAAVIFGLWLGVANAHESPGGMTYSGWCCNDNDCAPINYEDVTEHPDGSITFRHCRFRDVLIGSAEQLAGDGVIKQSTDGEWHACILPDNEEGWQFDGGPYQNNGQCRCLYRPPRLF